MEEEQKLVAMALEQEGLEDLCQEEAIAEPNEQQLDHGLCLCPCLCLYPSEEEEEVQPAVQPNEEEDADIVEQGKDSHSANQYEY